MAMDILLIIDMQESSFSKSDKYDSAGVIERINQLSEHVRQDGGKIIFIQHDGEEDEGLRPFTPGWAILSSLIQHESDIFIRKTTNDAFYKTGLNQHLKNFDDVRLIVSGWATDFCVDTTLRAAVSLGHKIAVASDCHTVSDRPHLKAKQVIEHHNWIWKNMLTPNEAVNVLPLAKLW
jgi:nicotinamidase-related amidase